MESVQPEPTEYVIAYETKDGRRGLTSIQAFSEAAAVRAFQTLYPNGHFNGVVPGYRCRDVNEHIAIEPPQQETRFGGGSLSVPR